MPAHTNRTPFKKPSNVKTPVKPVAEPLPAVTPGKAMLDYQQIQKDEIEVLKSVFMEDYEYIERVSAWNKSEHELKLRLKAPSDDEYFCVLLVRMSATYPKTAPKMTLTASSQIRPHHLERLHGIIEQMPGKLLGQEMIYEIAVALQDALEDIVQNRLVDQEKPSLDQERALKVISQQKLAEQEEEKERKRCEQEAKAEQLKLEKEIEDELRRQREHARETHQMRRNSTLLAEEEGNAVADSEDCILFDRTIKINPNDGELPFVFRKVCGMVKIAQGPLMTVFTVRPAFPAHESKNLPLILKQVELSDSFEDFSEGKRKIQHLEREIDSLRNLRHPNVVVLYESKVTRSGATGWRVSILTEYSNKGTLRDLLEIVDCVTADVARSWMISLLEGLDYVHRNGAIHGDIHAGNILLFRRRSGSHAAPKLADVSYASAIRDNFLARAAVKPGHWSPPEMSQGTTTTHKATRKADIWQLGVVFLQMIFGLNVVENYDSPQKLIDSITLSESLFDFLESIFRVDTKKRPTAFELLPSEFLRNDDPITQPESRASPLSNSGISWGMSNHHRAHSHSRGRRGSMAGGPGMSRYASDFVELGRLGKGGYGQVVKARNRLDGREYAIKQIQQTSGAKLTEILSEVVLLSRLNHRYVVRYFTAWLEDLDFSHSGGSAIIDADEDATISSEGSDGSDGSNESVSGIEFAHSTTGGLDFISNSAGYVYDSGESDEEEDTDEEDESDSDDEDSTASKRSIKTNALKRMTSNEKKRGKVTLYIQMSLAERLTLRDRIHQGLGFEEAWKLFRQILEGLSHIHGLGIIHRDLKPENIFIDLSGDPQIGDFGLAALVVKSEMEKSSNGEPDGEGDLTTNVGTALYVAPELRGKSLGNYNEKVDMYSLGVIFFEMVYPLGSGMERAEVLSKLRESDIEFPSDFWTEKRAVQGNIIKTLLSHTPSERPTSVELLNSGKLPFMIEDKTIKHALQSLSDPTTPYHKQVMQALFSQNTKEYKNHTYDIGEKERSAQDLIMHSLVKERLADIFRSHGAVETTRPLLMPRSKYYPGGVTGGKGVVQLMDQNGNLVQLPHDLTLPHARLLARSISPAPKTFTFGTVYRENAGGGQPRSHVEVDFDIVSNDSHDLTLKEAEVIKVIDEVIDVFPSLKGVQMAYHLNHSNLLDVVMDFCRIPAPVRVSAKDIVSKLGHGQWNWSKIRNELATSKLGILPTSLDDLAKFDWRDEPEKAFERLHAIFHGFKNAEKLKPVYEHLRSVIAYLGLFGVHRKVYISPLGTYNDKFYKGGVVFQCIYDSKKREVFAAGGRYDNLIQEHQSKVHGHAQETHVVGVNLGWEQLAESMSTYNKRLTKTSAKHGAEDEHHLAGAWATRRCDVIVSAFDSTALRSFGVSLLQELWANGIRAELGKNITGMDSLVHQYKHDGASWIVTVKQGFVSGERSLKVRNLHTKQDVELRNSELISWLKTELVEQERRSLQGVAARLSRHVSTHFPSDLATPGTPAGVEPHADVDVRILASDRKGRKANRAVNDTAQRKVNRKVIIDAALRNTAETSAVYLKCPIAAVDVKSEMLEEILKLSGPDDGEGWKKLVQSVPVQEKKYVHEIQELLATIKGEGHRLCWIFSFRSGVTGIVRM